MQKDERIQDVGRQSQQRKRRGKGKKYNRTKETHNRSGIAEWFEPALGNSKVPGLNSAQALFLNISCNDEVIL